MKILLSLFLLLAVSSFGAVPAYTSFRGAGGITIVSNPPVGTIIIDGSGVVASGTNSSMQVSTNNVASSTMASNINFTAGNNTVLKGTNIGSTAHINYGIASNLTFYSTLGNLVLGTWDGVFGFSNAASGSMSLYLAEPDTGNDWGVSGLLIATNVLLTAIPGSGTYAGVTASGTLYRTNAPSTTDTNIGVGQTIYLDKTFGVDATASRTNLLRPFQTPSNSVAAILSGDTLVVRGGAYPINPKADAAGEAVNWNFQSGVSITNKNNISIVGEAGAVWYMSAWRSNNLKFSAPMLRFENCTNVVVENMTFIGLRTNAVVLGHGGVVLHRCSEITFRNCTFSNWQDHGVVFDDNGGTYGKNDHLNFIGNTFADIGGTNHVTLTYDGVAIGAGGGNINVIRNHFYRNLRDIEYCCDEDTRKVQISLNTSEGCYFDHIMITGTNSSEIIVSDNIVKGYANITLPGASGDGSGWIKIYAGSNITVQGNIVGGFANGIVSSPTVGTKTVDIKILGNSFVDFSGYPIAMPSPLANMVGHNVIYERNTVKGNYFMNCASLAVVLNGNNSAVNDNTFIDCNLGAFPQGVVCIGWPTAGVATNSANISLVGNKLISSAANAGPGIVIYGMSSSNTVHGNEIDRKYATNIHNLGIGTRTRPVNLVAAGSLLRSDTNGNERAVVFGSGVGWDGVTGTLTGTGGAGGGVSTNEFQFGAIPTLTLKDGVNITNPVVNGFLEWGMWGAKVGFSNRAAANLALYLNDASDSFWTMPGRLYVGDRASVNTLTVSNMTGSGNHIHIAADGTTTRTNITGGTGASTNQVLTNLIGTVSRNVTNVVSLSTSNATSKPLTNSYAAGVLTVFGLEAGANTTITPNGSNLVVASTGGGGGLTVSGTNGQIAYINAAGTGLTNGTQGGSGIPNNPGFGFNPTGPNATFGGLMVFANDAMGLLTVGHPNFASDFETPAVGLVVSNRYSGGDIKQELVHFDGVDAQGGASRADSTLTTWRNWTGTNPTIVAELRKDGLFTTRGGMAIGEGSGTNGRALFYDMAGVKYSQLEAPGAVINTNTHRLWESTNAGVVVEYTTIAGINQLTNITIGPGQVVTHNGTSYVPEGKTSFTPILVAGTGSALTNVTFLATQPEVIVNGFTNVSITGVMGYDPARIDYWTLTITNGGGADRPLIFSQQTNTWRFSGVYGTNAPSNLTNMTALHISARSHGTNTRVGYTYFPWP